MALSEVLRSVEDRELLTHARAADFLHGCVGTEPQAGGWVRPLRFLPGQLRTLESCMAWHPGLYLQMARTTAGVCLRFRTDATEVALGIRLDPMPRATRARLRQVEGREPTHRHDGVSCDVDGRHLPVATAVELERGLPGLPGLAGSAVVTFSLEGPDEAPSPGLRVLPGFGRTREVTLWLPCLSGCLVGDLWTDGLTVEALPDRPELLVMGDGSAQGFVADDPGLTWPALLAKRLGMDLLDQGLLGQVFQQGTARGLAARPDPARIVVSFGAGYRHEPCAGSRTQREASGYLAEVAGLWPDVPCEVLTPLWHDEASSPSHAHSCHAQVPAIIRRAARPHASMGVADGQRLVDHAPDLFADADHPNARGAAELALRAYVSLLGQGRGSDDLRSRAAEVLGRAPERAFPLRACLDRGRVLLADEGCVLLRLPDGDQMVYAPDHELGRAAVALLCEPTVVTVCEPGFERDVMGALGLDLVNPFHLVVYEGTEPLPVDAARAAAIRPLDASHADVVLGGRSLPVAVRPDEVRDLLSRGRFLGSFEGEELVGFVGELGDGSIGMLEVLPGHRRQGWGSALEATKVNEVLARHETPWMRVLPYSKAGLRLQESLGLRVWPAEEHSVVSRKA